MSEVATLLQRYDALHRPPRRNHVERGQELGYVSREASELGGFGIWQEVGVLLHRGAAARGIDDDGIQAAAEKRAQVLTRERGRDIAFAAVDIQRPAARLRS